MKKTKVPISSLQLGMKKGPGGDWFEHDLADLAATIEKERQCAHPGCRVCFDYDLSRLKSEDGTRHPAIVVEGQAGYQPTTFDIGSTDKTALWNVERANGALALTKEDVKEIIASTMR
jgi:hypothetical protein